MTKREEAEQAMRLGLWLAPEAERVALLREAINEALEEAAVKATDTAFAQGILSWEDCCEIGDDIRALKKVT